MNIENISKNENKLLERIEITATISYESVTPSRKEIKEAICTKNGINPENAVLREVKTTFGAKKADVLVHAYDSKEKMMKTEPLYILVREGLAEKKKKEKKKGKAAAKK
ncbi:MAG: hypothetical protein QXF35_03960 [Candidatus Bilamarchaeaceae archaeon]